MRRPRPVASGCCLALALALSPAVAQAHDAAAEALGHSVRKIAQQESPPNDHIAAMPIWSSEAFGVGLGYDRALARRLSLGLELDVLAQPRELAHLQGIQETVALSVWPQRAFHGFVGRLTFSLGHQVFTRSARISSTAIAPGVEVGWRFSLPRGVTLGLLAALRWGHRVDDEPGLCTANDHCPAVREGVYGRLGLLVGYAF